MSEKKFTLSINDKDFKHTKETKAWLQETEDIIHKHMKDKWVKLEEICVEAIHDSMVYGVAMATISHKPNGDIIVENSLRKWVVASEK